MVRSNPIQNNFNGGEISPLISSRFDLESYQNGCEKLFNMIPRVQGPATRRPSSNFVKEVKNSANRTHIQAFNFNNDDSFILEFGDQYIRFYKDRDEFLDSSVHYEISTPYLASDLFDSKGMFRINFSQSADVIYLVHRSYAPRKLSRIANNNWTLTEVETTLGPFDDINTGSITVYSSAVTGSVTLTASSSIFESSDVGSQFYIETNPDITTHTWEVAKHYNLNDIVRSGGSYYKGVSVTAGTVWTGTQESGTVTPSHLSGIQSDGNIDWEYLHSGYGTVEITAYTSGTEVTATVLDYIPDNAVGSSNATKFWAFSAWSSEFGYPEYVTFYKERVVYARDIKVWFSVTGDFDNFALRDGPDIADDMAINLTILSNQYNGIKWLYPLDDLIIGTQNTVHIIGANTTQRVFGPTNVRSRSEAGRGSLPIPVVQVDNSLLFIQRSGTNVLSLAFDINFNKYNTKDISLISEHLFKQGVRQIVYQERPDNILWVVRDDGALIGLTLNEGQEVRGWHHHSIGGGGVVESASVIPSPDGDSDDLWIVVNRTIQGQTKRYIEYVGQYFDSTDTSDANFLDSSITYDGSSTTSITGLDHLEGDIVDVLVDGATHPSKTVSSGSITLDRAGSKVVVGYGYQSTLTTNSFETGATKGTAVNKTKRINRVGIRFLQTVGAKVGRDENNLTTLSFRFGSDNMDSPVPVFSETKDVTLNSSYGSTAKVTIVQDQPLPMTILSITPEMGTYER
jgi:hypothetical protein